MGIRRVALCGNNLVMSTIGLSLQKDPRFQVQTFEGLLPGDREIPHASLPEVVLFDLATAPADFAISVLRMHPMIMLIGVDLMNNKMLVLSGEQSRLLTADDLVTVITGGPLKGDLPGEPGGFHF